jgi:hypothetical protein
MAWTYGRTGRRKDAVGQKGDLILVDNTEGRTENPELSIGLIIALQEVEQKDKEEEEEKNFEAFRKEAIYTT